MIPQTDSAQQSYPTTLPTEDAVRELARWRGQGLRPQAGCKFARLPLGDSEALVEYEFIRAEPDQPNADKPNPGPGHPAQAVVVAALVNGSWIDTDCFTASLIERWEQSILEDAS